MIRCPKCRKAIALDATEHPACGWSTSSFPDGVRGPDGRYPDEIPTPKPPPEPEPTPEESRAAYERVRAMLAEVRRRPVPTPAARWRAILASPTAGFRAQELAREALAEIERRKAL